MRILFGNGQVEDEERSVEGFRSISVRGSGSLSVRSGVPSVRIVADSNILPYVTATVVDGELRLGLSPLTWVVKSSALQFEVTLPDLAGLRCSGSSTATVEAFTGDSCSVDVSGSGRIKAALDYRTVALRSSGSSRLEAGIQAGSLAVRCSGSSTLEIDGKAREAEISLSGSVHVEARGLAASVATVSGSGSSRLNIRAGKSLEAGASGSSVIQYWGNPSVARNVSGSGRVARAGD